MSNLVANEVGYNGKPIHVLDRAQEVKIATCNSNKAREILGYTTKISLKEAIKLTAEFIKKKGTKPFKYYIPIEIINEKTPSSWIKKLI